MKTGTKWFTRAAFVAAVAAAVMMGGPRPVTANDCNYDRPTSGPYTCPPLDSQTCFVACHNSGYQAGGDCIWPIGCCVCWWD